MKAARERECGISMSDYNTTLDDLDSLGTEKRDTGTCPVCEGTVLEPRAEAGEKWHCVQCARKLDESEVE